MATPPRLPACLPHSHLLPGPVTLWHRGETRYHTVFTAAGKLRPEGHAAAQSIVPAPSDAAKATSKITPELHGKCSGPAPLSPLHVSVWL